MKKITLLRYALFSIFIGKREFICVALEDIARNRLNYFEDAIELVPEIDRFRPPFAHYNQPWFGFGFRGWRRRLIILTRLIWIVQFNGTAREHIEKNYDD